MAVNSGDKKPQPTTIASKRPTATNRGEQNVAFKLCHCRRRLQDLPSPSSPSRSAIVAVAFKLCHHRRRLQDLPSSPSPSSSTIAAVIFKLCRCLQASPPSETAEMGERGEMTIFSLGREQQGEEWREKKILKVEEQIETNWAARERERERQTERE